MRSQIINVGGLLRGRCQNLITLLGKAGVMKMSVPGLEFGDKVEHLVIVRARHRITSTRAHYFLDN